MAVTNESAGAVGFELIRLVKLLKSARAHAPRLHPAVDPAAYPLLFTLADGPQRVSDLAECVHSDASTISRQVSGLVFAGLLEKVADPFDGRVQRVSLTASGANLMERIRQERAQFFQTLLLDWSPDEAEQFTAYVRRFSGEIEKSRERTKLGHANPPSAATMEITA
jgi:DNA-binding MarR family transcriptional regulator